MRYFLGLALLFYVAFTHATDVDRERRWIDQTVEMILDGEPLFLDSDGHRFLGIYTESLVQSSRGMIVLHGTGFHPDYEQVVQPVRVGMTEHGWNTLSIQLPILDKSAEYEEYVVLYPEVPPRLDAAIDYLQAKGNTHIVIVAHSQGATMAAYYLANFEHSVSSFVAIGMSAQHTQKSINSAESLKKITIPVLDIYGSKDFPAVLATNEQRRKAAAHNPRYSQLEIPRAYHFFDLFEKVLLTEIQNWLEAAGV